MVEKRRIGGGAAVGGLQVPSSAASAAPFVGLRWELELGIVLRIGNGGSGIAGSWEAGTSLSVSGVVQG